MSNKKERRLNIRTSETTLRKLLAICAVNKRNRTKTIEELILSEYGRSRKYENQYYLDLQKNADDL